MNLEINNKHKKIDFKNINKNALKAKVLSSLLAVTLFTGCTNQINKNNIEINNGVSLEDTTNNELQNKIDNLLDGNIVSVPQSFYSLVHYDRNTPVTLEYLESLKDINIQTDIISSKEELLWLNYCTNLETLRIMSFNDDILEYVNPLPNLKQLALYNAGKNTVTLDSNNSKILFSPNLDYLILQQYNIEKGLIEKLNNLSVLDIAGNNDATLMNYDIDYTKLTNLKAIIINNPYTLAIHLDNNELNALNESNVKIIDRGMNQYNDVISNINNKIDEIVSNLNINNSSSDLDKIDSIIMYVLNNLKYDDSVLGNLEEDTESNLSPFYEGGMLYGALEMDTAICGNYAALIGTLCDRLKLKEISQISQVHAWNLVYVDGNNYYIDATLIDNYINDEKDLEEVKSSSWYLKDPNEETDYNHTSINLSDLIHIEPISVNNNIDISNNEYKLMLNNKAYTLSGSALIGILSGFGLAYYKRKEEINKTNDKEKRM